MSVKRNETLPSLLSEVAKEKGGQSALIYGEEKLTFSQLEDRVARLTGGLANLGVSEGTKVAVWLPNTFACVELEFALARLGAIAVAINTKFRTHEVQDILARSSAETLVLWPGFKDIDFLSILEDVEPGSIPDLEHLVLLGGDIPDLQDTSLTSLHVACYEDFLTLDRADIDLGRPDAPCNAFTSSGTTSAPKLVLHSQEGICRHARAVAEAFSYTDSDSVVLGMLPFCGVFGFNTVMGSLAAGSPTVMMPVFDAGEVVRLIETHGVTHTNGSDEMLRRMLAAAASPENIPSLREAGFANFSGDPGRLVAEGNDRGKTFFQVYGSSEVQALMARQPAKADLEHRALGGGVPVSSEIQVRARDVETGALASRDETGELEIRGPNVMIGYINNPRAEQENLTADGYVRTGDLGYLAEEGFVYLTRLGDTMRIGGFLVSPREIESYLDGLPDVAASQVVGISDGEDTRAVGFIVLEEGREFDEEKILNLCRGGLAKYKVPRRLVALPDFPRVDSANGAKVKRERLRELAAEALEEILQEGRL